jgi:hypothetical protein
LVNVEKASEERGATAVDIVDYTGLFARQRESLGRGRDTGMMIMMKR